MFKALFIIFFICSGVASAESNKAAYPKVLKKAPLANEEVHSQDIREAAEDLAKDFPENQEETGAAPKPNNPLVAQKDKRGPRQGIIREAGRFKVELKAQDRGIDVFLVNLQEMAPVVESSDVEGQLYVGDKEYELRFRAVKSQGKFFAPWPDRLNPNQDLQGKEVSVVLLPTREKIIGAPVLYKLDRAEKSAQ